MTRPTTDVMEAKPSWLPTQNKYKRRENQKEKAMERPDNKIPFLIHSFPRSKSCCLFELLDSHNQNHFDILAERLIPIDIVVALLGLGDKIFNHGANDLNHQLQEIAATTERSEIKSSQELPRSV
uniref:Uncharacterized protein n=1 Tax=Rhizophora mucronata TaxID=61149 RepID=A0A2P2IYT9_RHIMU